MVEVGTASVVDVGTDHAYLPIFLVKNKAVDSCIAVDRLPGPLLNAKRNIEKYNVGDCVKTRLSDGLYSVLPDEADVVIMAGIGAENIVNIIRETPWLKDSRKTLILQPMKREEKLREYLAANSFEVLKEELALDSGKVYVVFKVKFCGKDLKFLLNDPGYLFFGSFSKKTEDVKVRLYLEKRLHKLVKLSGIKK